jgi:hypothetical protein
MGRTSEGDGTNVGAGDLARHTSCDVGGGGAFVRVTGARLFIAVRQRAGDGCHSQWVTYSSGSRCKRQRKALAVSRWSAPPPEQLAVGYPSRDE